MQRRTNRLKANNPTKEALLKAVEQAFEEYDVEILERMEGLQHEIYRCILRNDGGNQFDMPHSGVRERQKKGEDPCDRRVSADLIDHAKGTLAALRTFL